MRIVVFILFFLSGTAMSFGQELFPATEPASSMPKGVLGVRLMYETYKELPSQRTRYWDAVRLMYGATGKLTLMLTGSASNHHLKKFPADLRNYFINHHQVSYKPNPFLFEGLNFNARYRWLSIDEQNKHLRLAFYGEAAKSFVPHDEAEPMLGDNSGFGGGIIATKLHHKFALSVTCGYTYALPYIDKEQEIRFETGKGWHYNISLGYRLFPLKYSSYQNVNVNLYVEFINKTYDKARLTVKGEMHDFEVYKDFDPVIYKSLIENQYSEIRPSIQFIFNSNERIDIGIAQPFYGKSYLHFYPMFFFNLQKYIFSKGKARLAPERRSDDL